MDSWWKRVKWPRRTESPARKRGAGMKVACAAAVGALAAGCPGVPVRAPPAPEDCPPGAVETMDRLGLDVGVEYPSRVTAKFANTPYADAEHSLVTVREGPGVQLTLPGTEGQLKAGTVVVGRWIFGKARVYGRFTEARVPGGGTYPVCLEAWDYGSLEGRGLVRDRKGPPNVPGAAHVNARPSLQAVERFE